MIKKNFFFGGHLKFFILHKKGCERKKVHAFTLIDHLKEGGEIFTPHWKNVHNQDANFSLLKCTQHNGCLPGVQ